MAERTRHQQKIIKNYYDNRETIALQRLQELVTELYLSEGKKRKQNWDRAATQLENLGVGKPTIEHLLEQDNPELLAEQIQRLMK